MVIRNFKNKGIEDINCGRGTRETFRTLPKELHRKGQIKLARLGAVTSLPDLQEIRGNRYTPVHPGEVLQDELQEAGLTPSGFEKNIGVLPKTINEICRGKRGISAEMAMKLSKALGGSPQFWLNLQNNWEIRQIDDTAYEDIKHAAA